MKSLKELKGYVLLLEADEAEVAAPEASPPAEPAAPQKSGKPSDIAVLKKGDVSAEKVIDKLNTIRAGRSFKDPNIKTALSDYINSLKVPERIALFAFLKGVSQIMSGEVAGESAMEPADPAPSIEMKKVTLKRQIKPTVVMPKSADEEKPQEEVEAPKKVPTPIKPK